MGGLSLTTHHCCTVTCLLTPGHLPQEFEARLQLKVRRPLRQWEEALETVRVSESRSEGVSEGVERKSEGVSHMIGRLD
jgi:hypothetical protein